MKVIEVTLKSGPDFEIMNYAERLEQEISLWPHVSAHSHRFGGRKFRFGKAEVGHVHRNGAVDIPFTRSIRDALIKEGLAGEHRWAPDSGWITFRIRNDKDFDHALWLVKLSFLRYAVKIAFDAREFLEQEAQNLQLSPGLKSLLEKSIPGARLGLTALASNLPRPVSKLSQADWFGGL